METNRNELELKSNGNVDYNNEKEITAVEKQLINLRRRRHEEYLDYRLSTNKISGNAKEASNLAPNIQLVSSNSNKTDNTSLGNLSGKSVKRNRRKGNLQCFLNKPKLLMSDQHIKKTKGKKLKTIDPSQFYHLSQKFMKN